MLGWLLCGLGLHSWRRCLFYGGPLQSQIYCARTGCQVRRTEHWHWTDLP